MGMSALEENPYIENEQFEKLKHHRKDSSHKTTAKRHRRNPKKRREQHRQNLLKGMRKR